MQPWLISSFVCCSNHLKFPTDFPAFTCLVLGLRVGTASLDVNTALFALLFFSQFCMMGLMQFIFVSMCKCMFICVCVHMYMGVFCVCSEHSLTSDVIPQEVSTLVQTQRLLLAWSSPRLPAWLLSAVPCLPQFCHVQFFKTCVLGSKLKSSYLQGEPRPDCCVSPALCRFLSVSGVQAFTSLWMFQSLMFQACPLFFLPFLRDSTETQAILQPSSDLLISIKILYLCI